MYAGKNQSFVTNKIVVNRKNEQGDNISSTKFCIDPINSISSKPLRNLIAYIPSQKNIDEVIIMDEPTVNIDRISEIEMIKYVLTHSKDNVSVSTMNY